MKHFHPLTELQWQLLEPLLPSLEKRGRGKPHTPWRQVLNTVLYVHYTGSKWAHTPTGPEWASKSSAHRWMINWKKNGLFEQIIASMVNMEHMASEIHCESTARAHAELMPAQLHAEEVLN